MKKTISTRSALIIVLLSGSITLRGQNISVTFNGTGAATQIDSVTATNLTTNQKVTLPGNETLVLTANTGIPTVGELSDIGIVYPNPFSGSATFSMRVRRPQTVNIRIQNFIGQVVAQAKEYVQAGENEFELSINAAGHYTVSVTTDLGKTSYKVICTGASESENRIQYIGTGSINQNNLSYSGLKTSQTAYTLGYTSGEIILYKCISGMYTTIITDSPTESKNYRVEFVACTDLDGKNYSIVKIWEQTWMAENLAYLPSVSLSSTGSDTEKRYYVYGYEGTSVSLAKQSSKYGIYGVLYNWPAALTACPSGWHLPTDEEWKILEKNQGMSQSDVDAWGWRSSGAVGDKLKEAGASHWNIPFIGANNSSGFTALPGGYLMIVGVFYNLRYDAHFWSSTEYGSSNSLYRLMDSASEEVKRFYEFRRSGFSVRCLQND